jgi:O-antigen ligase
MAIHVAVFVLLSPLWAFAPSITSSASHGAAVSLAYLVVVRWTLRQRSDFELFGQLIAAMCLVYSVYFLLNAEARDLATTRRSVEFANANYTGAVLAFGAIVTLWFVTFPPVRSRMQLFWAAAFAIDAWAVFETGSRASLIGLAAAVVVVVFLNGRWILVRHATLATLGIGFTLGFFPQSEKFFGSVSELTSYETLQRDDNLSGREEIWTSARSVVAESWFLGYGPEGYRFRGHTQILAHSWGLEYMASVGIVGTSVIALIIWFCFTGQRVRTKLPPSRHAWLWNSATALSLLPNLVLSTHQWTLWAWVGFALWSKSYLLDSGRTGTRLAPQRLSAGPRT